MDEQQDADSPGQTPSADDAADLALVAQLAARTGIVLTTAEIGELVAAYRYDRRGLDRMRTMLVSEDETAHSFQAARVMHPPGTDGGVSTGGPAGDAGAGSGR